MNKEDGVSSCWYVTIRTKSLCKSPELLCICPNPQIAITTLAEFIIFGNGLSVRIDGSAVQSLKHIVIDIVQRRHIISWWHVGWWLLVSTFHWHGW